MSYFSDLKNAVGEPGPGHISFDLLTAANGCRNGCCGGISRYTETQYQTPGCHDDQEGFVVLSGHGKARIGNEEARVSPGSAFIAPAGVEHSLCTEDPTVPLVVFWFHAAI